MSRLIHLSDLHFGRTDDTIVASLLATVHALQPDVVVVSGDLTQRAKIREFQWAKAFLDRLPQPVLTVPGNHDVPLYNLFARFLRPLERYERLITPNKMPVYVDHDVTIVGASSARSFTIAGGRLGRTKLSLVAREFSAAPPETFRLLVAHHPIDVFADRTGKRAKSKHIAAPELIQCGVDVVLSGHLHTTSAHAPEAAPDVEALSGMLLIGAGTATSTRHRGETNSFNVIELKRPTLILTHHHWCDGARAFLPSWSGEFRRQGRRWLTTERLQRF